MTVLAHPALSAIQPDPVDIVWNQRENIKDESFGYPLLYKHLNNQTSKYQALSNI
jgi:hypothetical protein